ncbi:hypothetical protein ALQ33_05101 [Pseudomonas syringae pv. philadelphi]|uniref:CsbD-like domain-containing protein n=2 Tax=Pseudomonas TaxID=286 RepID=A0A3M3Z3X1_9PSED|nr:hypothetical protein ALQ33_05101 [Pseudomonas syringae pv. philadelphi]
MAHLKAFHVIAHENCSHFQMQQLIGLGCVHQQVQPLVLAYLQARNRQVEPPDVALGVEHGKVGVVDAKHCAAQILVSARNGQLFIEFHNVPASRIVQPVGLACTTVPRILAQSSPQLAVNASKAGMQGSRRAVQVRRNILATLGEGRGSIIRSSTTSDSSAVFSRPRRFSMSSTSDKIKGMANEAVGNVKQAVGKATDNTKLQVEGKAQELKGEGQQAKGEVKDAVKKGVDKV